MAHQALYRKYRSRSFDEIIGQDIVVKTLKNQILSGSPAHAYLFCGIRGTGKTSLARILSRALNCTNSENGNPCNECESCKSILNETNVNVVEMDGASNNGVGEVRELREKAKFLPVNAKYKIYIIDEAHMLTKAAFNALLKILEEPPEYLVFMLATTEPQAIPATILSRCQRFDLNRITMDDMVKRMKEICSIEGIEAEDKALRLIAGNSDGAMRDALSILDRCITFNSTNINYDNVNQLLGIVSFDKIIELCDYIINKDIKSSMLQINEAISQGKDLQYLIEEIILYFRNLLIYKTTGEVENLIRINSDNVDGITKNVDKLHVDSIIFIIKKLSATLLDCKRATNPRIVFESTIISLMNSAEENDILKRIEKIESSIKNGVAIRTQTVANNNLKIKSSVGTQQAEKKIVQPPENKDNIAIKSISDEDAMNKITDQWDRFIGILKKESVSTAALVKDSTVIQVKDKIVYFQYDSTREFHYISLGKDKNKDYLKAALLQFLGDNLDVNVSIANDSENNSDMEDIIKNAKNDFGLDKVTVKDK